MNEKVMIDRLKELRRPPFYYAKDGVIVDKDDRVVATIYPLAGLCPWFYDFAVAALNEKWERENGDPA